MNTCTFDATQTSAFTMTASATRILSIDDDPDISHAVELHMRPFGVKVHRAFHGMQGFAEAIRWKPDLILLDLAMPNGDGQTILECIRRNQATRAIPVIVLTGMRNPTASLAALRAGANHVLRKPIHLDELTRQVARYLGPLSEGGEASLATRGVAGMNFDLPGASARGRIDKGRSTE